MDNIMDNSLRDIALTLAARGLVIRDDLVPRALIAQLADEARALQDTGGLRAAGIGRGQHFRANSAIRSDHIQWLDPERATAAQRHYLGILEELRLAINRTLFLGLFEFEGHLAVYPPGAFYRKHLDQFQGTQHRLVTVILYLNPDWREADGGQLRIHVEAGGGQGAEGRAPGEGSTGRSPCPAAMTGPEGRYLEVLPLAGRLVCFLSGDFPHEVLPARRERLSITGWFRQRRGLPGV